MGQFARIGLLRTAGVVAAIALIALTVAPVTADAGTAPNRIITRLSGMQPAPLSRSGARVQKAAAAAKVMHLRLYFSSPDQTALQTAAQAIANPSSPRYRHYLTVSQFRALYAPPASTTQAVNRYLTSQGVAVGTLDPNGMSEPVSGTVGELNAALHTTMQQVRTAAGAQVLGSTEAPGLPANLAPSISYIDGLTPWVQVHDNIARSPMHAAVRSSSFESKPAASSPTCPQLLNLLGTGASPYALNAADLESAYKLSGFYAKGDTGQNETIGLIEYDSYDSTAVTAWEQLCLGVAPMIYVNADSTFPPPSTPQTIEATADIETLMDVAPSANIAVYETANVDQVDLDPWTAAIGGVGDVPTLPSVISSSWGLCEPEASVQTGGSGLYSAETTLFSEAAAQGQTILVASGDSGSEACFDPTASSPNRNLAVNDPASHPLVTAVGGTDTATVTGAQYVWNTSEEIASANCGSNNSDCVPGASGGGLSAQWNLPTYQPSSTSLQTGCASGEGSAGTYSGTAGCREVPDVSALAGYSYIEMCTSTGTTGTCPYGGNAGTDEDLIGVGGTSLAAPSWAGAIALTDQQCQANIGFVNPLIYGAATNGVSLVGKVTIGNNDFTGTNSRKYGALASGTQNLATGLGYLGGVDLSSNALCLPNAPSSVNATPGNTSASLSWAAPGYSGTSPISGYTATVAPPGSGPVTCTTGAPGSPCQFIGLTNGSPYSFSVTATNGSGTGPAAVSSWVTPAPTIDFPGWTHLGGAATAISEGSNGSVWVVGTGTVPGGHPIYEWNGHGWTQSSGGAVTIAVGPNGLPWVTNNANQIFQFTSKGWVHEPGFATAISVGANGTVWIIGTAGSGNHPIYKWNGSGWVQVPGGATRVAVGPTGVPWVVNYIGQIFQWNGGAWLLKPGAATTISEGGNGAVWVIGAGSVGNNGVFLWTGTTWTQKPGLAVTVAVGPTGLPWAVNSGHQIFDS